MEADKHFVVGIFDDEDVLLEGVKKVRAVGIRIHEVYSPFPVHGLDEALGYARTRLPIAAFLFGMTGTILALTMQFWMLGYDWPMIIGGKNFASLPPFIPVTFELTVLLSALGMVATFLIVSDMKPYKWPRQFDIRSTDDKHVMAVDLAENAGKSKEEIMRILRESGASEVNEKNFE
ncbi:MAG: membrane protein [Cyclobacteriaceae bacterium]|nr:MAG: membrane protein [Cyclobacteriaceae bacterium]